MLMHVIFNVIIHVISDVPITFSFSDRVSNYKMHVQMYMHVVILNKSQHNIE